MRYRSTGLHPAILLTCLGCSLVAATGCGQSAPPVRVSMRETTAFNAVVSLFLRPWQSDGPTDRLSEGAIPEFDVNGDGRLSDLEKARAAAIIRENRKELARYANMLSGLRAWVD